MTRQADLRSQFLREIQETAARLSDHESINQGRVLEWIEQFDDEDLECAVQLLRNIRYYSAPRIREMLPTLVRRSYQKFRGIPKETIYFVPVGNQGSGSGIIARALRNAGVDSDQIIHMLELNRLPDNEVGGIVFIDDFSGTGDSLVGWWETVEMMVRPKNADWVVAVLVLNESAEEKLHEFTPDIVWVEQLSDDDNVLSPDSLVFTEAEKQTILEYCARTECDERYLKGYGDCGLLLAFKHGCPDNSLPILWWPDSDWKSLFLRTAI